MENADAANGPVVGCDVYCAGTGEPCRVGGVMGEELMLPGSIPGLLRRGSPVIVHYNRPYTGVVVDIPAGFEVAIHCEDKMSELEEYRADEVHLDLTDATGRAHAAWWLAKESKHWPSEPVYTDAVWAQWVHRARFVDSMRVWGLRLTHWWPCNYQAFDGLSPDDPRLLPDGSRYVDAEALRRVCLHVAGLEE